MLPVIRALYLTKNSSGSRRNLRAPGHDHRFGAVDCRIEQHSTFQKLSSSLPQRKFRAEFSAISENSASGEVFTNLLVWISGILERAY
jgi:hypothetical protein